jgi:TPR repeat protein
MGRLLGEVAARIRGRPWGQNATRLAILEAARRIAACDGADAVSLSRTADEAGFARPTVYGHFRNKEELVVSVVADDIVTLGRMMRKVAPVPAEPDAQFGNDDVEQASRGEEAANENYSDNSNAEAADDASEEPAESGDVEFTADEINAAIDDARPEEEDILELSAADALCEEPAGQEEDVYAPEPDSSGLLWQETYEPEAQADEGESGPVDEDQAPEPPAPGDNPRIERRSSFTQPRVDAWLERRLRVFEHTLAEVSARIEKSERVSERAEGNVAEGMRDFQQHLDAAEARAKDISESLIRRIEALEQRNNAAIANLRAELEHANGGAPKAETLVHEDKLTFIPALPEEPRPKAEPSDSYLDAARRAANAAAELAESDRNGPLLGGIKLPANDDARQRYTRYIITGVAVLAVTLVGAGLLLRHGSDDVKKMSPVPKMASAHAETMPSQNMLAAAPLDRLTQLANSGDAEAELIVGLKYMNGGSDTSAAQWLERAANGHEAVAQYTLGSLYERGIGVGKNPAEAVKWYQQAADQGNRKAMYRLGIAYAQGTGVDIDYSKSAEWFEKAANAGLVDAQFNLAVLYERGEGVPQSLLDAYKWYAIAAAHGDKESAARVEALSAQMAPDDLQVAQKSVQQFAAVEFDRQANLEPTIADVTGPQ